MSSFFEYVLINCFAITLIWVLFQDDMLFCKSGQWMESNLSKYIHKPLFSCLICMSSVWGTLFFISEYGFDFRLYMYHELSVGGLMTIISVIINRSLKVKPSIDPHIQELAYYYLNEFNGVEPGQDCTKILQNQKEVIDALIKNYNEN